MAYTTPTLADFRLRFPAFATSASDDAVTAALLEAASFVDESWIETDFAPARMLYAGHILTLDGMGPNSQIAGYLASGVRSFSSGQLSVTFADSVSVLGSTAYGARFLALRNRNAPAILAVNAAVE